MNKLTRARVVPTIWASASCEIFGMSIWGSPGFPNSRHKQQHSREPLFAGIEKLIDEIRLSPHASREHESQKVFGKCWLLVYDTHHFVTSDLEDRAGGDRCC